MADNTAIEWTDATWNPITGCSVHSAGCTHCYAMKLAGTRLRHHWSRTGLTKDTKAGPVWTGEVRFNEAWLTQPIGWKKPRRIFVCAHADLFHENVPDAWIDRIFAVMALAPQHQFQVLTKRAERMRRYMEPFDRRRADALGEAVIALGYTGPLELLRWPLPNVWLGVSAEDQKAADERIPHLLATPAAVRWISAEPLIGRIWLWHELILAKANAFVGQPATGTMPGLDWVVAGGESGAGARPMHPDWARSLRDQCQAAGVPFLFKQWGEHVPVGHVDRGDATDPVEFAWERVGKKAAGRLLDGRTWDEYPA